MPSARFLPLFLAAACALAWTTPARADEENEQPPIAPPVAPPVTEPQALEPAPAEPPKAEPPKAVTPAPETDDYWTFALGPQGGMMTGIAPTVAPAGGLSYSFALRTARVFGPSFHISADVAGTDQGSTAYRWVGGVVRACPIHALLFGRRLRLAPCASMQVGLHHESTSSKPTGSSRSVLWLAPVAGASVFYVVTPTLGIELHGGAVFPLQRTRFALPSDATIYEVPAVAATTMLAVHLRFF